ncbi:hypothetical protein DKT69_33740 [Micromonospora sicca]|uniref:Uncharacterized protein n=1 Tax=Micromonospora sicca TaxID=2202420 RepID=A0A317D5S0_9ACTN|nr:hypothetical protein DKT69_33740 [Micromonospora sp. 4G51]
MSLVSVAVWAEVGAMHSEPVLSSEPPRQYRVRIPGSASTSSCMNSTCSRKSLLFGRLMMARVPDGIDSPVRESTQVASLGSTTMAPNAPNECEPMNRTFPLASVGRVCCEVKSAPSLNWYSPSAWACSL